MSKHPSAGLARTKGDFFARLSEGMKARWPAFEPMQVPQGYWPDGVRFFRLNARNQCFLLTGFAFEASGTACSTYVGWNPGGTLPVPGRHAVALEGSLACVKAASHPRDFRHEELFVELGTLRTQAPLLLSPGSIQDVPFAVAATLDGVRHYGLPYFELMLKHRHGLLLQELLQTHRPIMH